jgi:hypothetical protein
MNLNGERIDIKEAEAARAGASAIPRLTKTIAYEIREVNIKTEYYY